MSRAWRVRNEAPRILIVRVGAMGDVIHALPAVAALRAALPEAHIGWAIEPRWAPLLRAGEPPGRHAERMPLVDRVHWVEAKRWNKAPLSRATLDSIGELRASLRAERYDLSIDLQGTMRSAAIARIGGAAPVVGSAAPREGLARIFYGTRVTQEATHVVDRGLELVEAALDRLGSLGGIVASDTRRALRESSAPELHHVTSSGFAGGSTHLGIRSDWLPRDPSAESWWLEQSAVLTQERPAVLLAATAGWGAKEWPTEQFAALSAALVARGFAVLLNTAPGEIDPVTARVLRLVCAEHAAAASQVHALQATLPQLIAATRTVRAVIAGDTGPLHLAHVQGVPTVGLFGPTDPRRTGPRGPHAVNLRDTASVTDHRRHAETEAGLRRIGVDAVLESLEGVLQVGLPLA